MNPTASPYAAQVAERTVIRFILPPPFRGQELRRIDNHPDPRMTHQCKIRMDGVGGLFVVEVDTSQVLGSYRSREQYFSLYICRQPVRHIGATRRDRAVASRYLTGK